LLFRQSLQLSLLEAKVTRLAQEIALAAARSGVQDPSPPRAPSPASGETKSSSGSLGAQS
jgi:hypothetical protein